MTATACFITLLAIQLPSLVLGNDGFARQETRQRFPSPIAQSSTPLCQAAGYYGCCNSGSCRVQSGSSICYCDRNCHQYNDCCQDIFAIGCYSMQNIIQQLLQVTCNDLTSPNNGVVTYDTLTSGPKAPGTVAHFSCDQNYVLVGQSTLTCQANSTWSGIEPQCQATCGNLPVLQNGRITYEPAVSIISSRKPVRTVAISTCNEGYSLFSERTRHRVCQNSGSWSGSNARCRVHSCMIRFAATGGCCHSGNCLVGNPRDHCYCSVNCFTNDRVKCCPDIGCAPQRCTQAGINNGCCDWNTAAAGCYVPEGDCFCDRECHTVGDCCPGINNATSCSKSSAENQHLIGQRVRTDSYLGKKTAFRLRGNLNQHQKLEDNKAARKLASELRSLSQTQNQQRFQWETILKELQELQKPKMKRN